MSQISEFLAMGGYAAYVWPAYGAAAAVMAGLWLASLRSARAQEAEFKRLKAAGERMESTDEA